VLKEDVCVEMTLIRCSVCKELAWNTCTCRFAVWRIRWRLWEDHTLFSILQICT